MLSSPWQTSTTSKINSNYNGKSNIYNKFLLTRLQPYVAENQKFWKSFARPHTYAYSFQALRVADPPLYNFGLAFFCQNHRKWDKKRRPDERLPQDTSNTLQMTRMTSPHNSREHGRWFQRATNLIQGWLRLSAQKPSAFRLYDLVYVNRPRHVRNIGI